LINPHCINKQLDFVHCRYNHTILEYPIKCKKCQSNTNQRIKNFYKISSLYQHILYFHSGMDKMEYPVRDDCIQELQKLSDLINSGVSI